MCLILLKPKEIKLPKLLFKNVALKNRDGFGFMYLDEGKIKYNKTSKGNWEEHWDMYEQHNDKHIALHWRFKTEGGVTENNTHPFVVIENELMMMHNGMINSVDAQDDESDTNAFVKNILQPYLENLKVPSTDIANKVNKKIISKFVGDNNKLMFLNNDKFFWFNQFYVTDKEYIPEMQGIIFSNVYAWDNQYWYKEANQNEFNNEYVTKKSTVTSYPSYSNNNDDDDNEVLDYYSSRFNNRYGSNYTKRTNNLPDITKKSDDNSSVQTGKEETETRSKTSKEQNKTVTVLSRQKTSHKQGANSPNLGNKSIADTKTDLVKTVFHLKTTKKKVEPLHPALLTNKLSTLPDAPDTTEEHHLTKTLVVLLPEHTTPQ